MLDLDPLAKAIKTQGKIVRIVIAETRGSTPRGAGTDMLVWQGGSVGTIGGGRLELEAEHTARQMLSAGPDIYLRRQPLGPALNQCCGGAVTLVFECFDAEGYHAMSNNLECNGIRTRAIEPDTGDLPDSARRQIKRMEQADTPIPTSLTQGWLIEPVWRNRLPVHIYGAGHVGRALALILTPFPQFDVTLIDIRQDRFDGLPDNLGQSWTLPQTEVMAAAPDNAAHFIMTPEHDYDLELCHHLLSREFGIAGLIGSATKWARFRKKLKQLGHSETQINRIQCPIGDPALGKQPQAIAISVAATLLNEG